jgi:FkbM family methyltransferase
MQSTVYFFWKKLRLLGFLLRRTPRLGLVQLTQGLRNRRLGYDAMEFAGILPGEANVVIDVGAHRGDVAAALDFLYRPVRLIAVEPNRALGDFLRNRFAAQSHIEIVTEALAERAGTASFQVYGFDAASSFFQCRQGRLSEFGFDESHRATTVATTTLAQLLARRSISRVDLLKLDCQGAELMVLKGAEDRLSSIGTIYIEVSFEPIYEGAPLFGEVHAWLIARGFALTGLHNLSGVRGSVQWADAIYVQNRKANP